MCDKMEKKDSLLKKNGYKQRTKSVSLSRPHEWK